MLKMGAKYKGLGVAINTNTIPWGAYSFLQAYMYSIAYPQTLFQLERPLHSGSGGRQCLHSRTVVDLWSGLQHVAARSTKLWGIRPRHCECRVTSHRSSAVVGIWARKEHESQHAIVGSHLRASDSTIKTLH